MKAKSIRLTKPCQENWEDMTPTEKGRFCQQCSKNVLDLTQSSIEEITHLFNKNKNGFCARMRPSQMKYPILQFEADQRFNVPFSKVGIGLLLAGSIAVTSSCNLGENNIPKTEQTIQPNQRVKTSVEEKKKKPAPRENQENNDDITFKGKVFFNDSESPLASARVLWITKTKIYSTFTSNDGSFMLYIPKQLVQDRNVLKFSFDDIEISHSPYPNPKKSSTYYDLKETSFFPLSNFKNEEIIITRKEVFSYFNFNAKGEYAITGAVISAEHNRLSNEFSPEQPKTPLIIQNGKEIRYPDYSQIAKYYKPNKNRADAEVFYLTEKAGKVLFGKRAEYGLIIIDNVIYQN